MDLTNDADTKNIILRSYGVSYFNGGNVGIGTTSPSEKLEVAGVIKLPYNSSNSYYFSQDNGTFGYGKMRPFNNSGFYTFDTYYLYDGGYKFLYNGTEQMRITSAGNVGIGTTSPLAPLDVNGNIYSSGNVLVDNIYSRSGSSDLNLEARSGYGVNIKQLSGNSIAYFDYDTTNVGIGTTTPNSKLEIFVNSSSGAASTSDDNLIIEDDGNSYINIKTPTTSVSGILFSDATRGRGQITYAHSDDALRFVTLGAEKMRITSAGNVGIGTTSPSEKLHVVGDTFIDGGLKVNAANIDFTGLGTTDPSVAGRLWNDRGTLKISAGE